MKISLTICVLLLCSITAHAQIRATTDDGKAVVLKTDGTWTYADQSEKVTLKIEAGIAYNLGVQPMARAPFVLLDTDPTPELTKLPPVGSSSGIQQLASSCRVDHPEATAIIRKSVKHSTITSFDGKGEIKDIKPGKYWLCGIARAVDGCVMWLMPVDLTKSQSLTLDQNNAKVF